MRLSNAKVRTWRRCPKQYEFRYVLGLTPKRREARLEMGSWLHELLMTHYDGEDWRERHRLLTARYANLFEEEREELGDIPTEAERLMRSYLLRYRHEDQSFRVIDTELDEVLTLPNGLEFNFIIDLIVEEADGGLWLWDHKFLSSFMPADFMLIDAQLTRYFWGAEKLGYSPLRGVIFNEVLTVAPTVPEQLKSGELTRRQNLASDAYTYLREIKRLGLDPKDYTDVLRRLKSTQDERFFRRTRLPKDRPTTQTMMAELVMSAREIKRAQGKGEFPRTPEKSCRWECPFLEPCVIQLQGGDISDVLKMRYTTKPKSRKEK